MGLPNSLVDVCDLVREIVWGGRNPSLHPVQPGKQLSHLTSKVQRHSLVGRGQVLQPPPLVGEVLRQRGQRCSQAPHRCFQVLGASPELCVHGTHPHVIELAVVLKAFPKVPDHHVRRLGQNSSVHQELLKVPVVQEPLSVVTLLPLPQLHHCILQ